MVEDDPFVDRYARRIRAARATLALTQEQFGELVGGVTERTVRGWEKGMNLPQAQHRIRLQQIFDEVDAEDQRQRAAIGI